MPFTPAAPDAMAVGARGNAILALQGKGDDLDSDEKPKADCVRAVSRATMTADLYKGLESKLGQRGSVEFTAFAGC